MKLPADITEAIIKEAGRLLATEFAPVLEDLQLFTISDVCARLKVSDPTARRLIKEHVDLGAESKRITPAQLRALIEKRTVKST